MDLSSLFKDKTIFETSLTHKSWVNENRGVRESNERLEFLGDAILEFLVSEKIYNTFADKDEGYLTSLRANLVNTKNLARIAQKLNLGKMLFLSKGEEETGGRKNESLLADTLEALIGALFIDGGLSSASEFLDENLFKDLQTVASKPLKDAKSRLQELVQTNGNPAPIYKVLNETGPDHDKCFEVGVFVDEVLKARGEGKNKSEAEQKAAESALEKK
jgi:ribonuclease III